MWRVVCLLRWTLEVWRVCGWWKSNGEIGWSKMIWAVGVMREYIERMLSLLAVVADTWKLS